MITTNIVKKLLLLIVTCLITAGNTSQAACNIVDGKGYGDCAGVQINKNLKGHVTVRSPSSQDGIIEGATVLKNGVLRLSGVSNGDITVYRGGRLVLTGAVNGTVRNLGGNVEIEGILDHLQTTGGKVVIAGNVGSVSGAGPIEYKKGAVVGGKAVEVSGLNVGKK